MAVRDIAFDDLRVVGVPWRKILGGLLAFLGVLVGGYLVTNTYSVAWQQHLESRWEGMVASQPASPAAPVAGQPVARVVIPDLSLDRVVIEGDDAASLRKAPGHVPGSALPGELGNAVIRGHRILWSGPFRELDKLNYGSEILVQTVDGSAVYLVSGIFHQDGERTDVYAQTALPFLTLVTSDPPLRADRVLVVRAAMVERDGESP